MQKNHYNYNPNKVDLIIDGIRMYDFGEDVKFTVAYEEDFREVITGVDGDSTTVEHNNRNALITLKVLAASPLNVTLKRLASSAKEFGVLVGDRNFNGDIGSNASKAHFVKIADFNAEKAPKAREWQIRVIDLKETNDLLK